MKSLLNTITASNVEFKDPLEPDAKITRIVDCGTNYITVEMRSYSGAEGDAGIVAMLKSKILYVIVPNDEGEAAILYTDDESIIEIERKDFTAIVGCLNKT